MSVNLKNAAKAFLNEKVTLPALPSGYWWSTYDGKANLIVCEEGKESHTDHSFRRSLLVAYVRPQHGYADLFHHKAHYQEEMEYLRFRNAQDAIDTLYVMMLTGVFADYRRKQLNEHTE